MIRITAGKYKNKKLATRLKGFKEIDYRPASDHNRQAMFNIILNSKFIPYDFVQDAVVADLFCGSGSFGLEALSRGAKHVIFVDNSPEQIKLTRHNADSLGELDNCTFITSAATMLPRAKNKCNLVYIDPPYGLAAPNNPKYHVSSAVLDVLVKQSWLAKHNLVVIECGTKDKILLPKNFSQLEEREHGATKIIFCSYYE